MSVCNMKKIYSLILICISIVNGIAIAEVADNKKYNVSRIHENVGDMDFEYSQAKGIRLSVGGTSFITATASSLSVVSPGWIEKYFLTVLEPSIYMVETVEFGGGKKIILTQKSTTDPEDRFSGKQIFTLLPDNTFIVEAELQFSGESEAVVEYLVGGINPLPIINQPYTVQCGDKITNGIIPLDAVGTTMQECIVARDFDKLTIESRIGKIEIISDMGEDACMFDYRKNRWAEFNNPFFWFGFLEKKIASDKSVSYKLVFKFESGEAKDEQDKIAKRAKVNVKRVSNAVLSNWEQNYILPTPKQIDYTADKFPLSDDTVIYIGSGAGETLDNAVKFLLDDLDFYYGVKPRVVSGQAPAGVKNAIIIGNTGRYEEPVLLCSESGAAIPEHEEGYSLAVDCSRIAIGAKTEQGLFYGITTLLQLAKFDNGKLSIKGAKIVDYPAMDFRGVHFFAGRNADAQICKAVKNLLARYKINSLVWQCDFVKWDACKGLESPAYGMDKEDAKKVVDAARANNVELIPLMPSLGHSEWIFQNGKNIDIAEDPETPYSYCPTNPKTYDFIFGVYQELLDFFKPRHFHIGHDEVSMIGRFPYRSKDTGKSETQLVAEDINKLHEWFTAKGVKIGMWGDMLLHNDEASSSAFAPSVEEAKLRRDMIPDDVVIYDWHYEVNTPENFKSFKVFKDAGKEVVGSTWSNPDNIRNVTEAIMDCEGLGILQTTWAGFNFSIDTNKDAWSQYWAYLLAAEYSWTGKNVPAADLKFNPANLFLQLWKETKPISEDKAGYVFDLRKFYNRSLSDDENLGGWLGYGQSMDMSDFPKNESVFGNTRYMTAENRRGESVVLMNGNLNPKGNFPDSITIDTARISASELRLLVTSAFKVKDKTKVGLVELKYSDGSTGKCDLVYGENIFSFTDARVDDGAKIVWRGKTKNGEEICIHDCVLKNPSPAKKIVSIRIDSFDTDSALIVFALTAVK